MKRSTVLIICLSIALIISFTTKKGTTQKNTIKGIDNPALQTIISRKSVRHFTEKQVSRTDLEKLVKAGMSAPTAMNSQPWAFIIIDEKEILDYLAEDLPYAKMLFQATSAIVVCGDMTKALPGVAKDFWIQDCSAATENILIAAEGLGLGAVWTGVYPIEENIKTVRENLEIPEEIIPLCVIPVGYPTGVDKPKNKWKKENVHWQKW